MARSVPVVTFDAGQCLVELDLDFLVTRLAERGFTVERAALAGALAPAWAHHDRLVAGGAQHPWHALMTELLDGAGIDPARRDETVAWLWSEQPRANLWRKPIPGMVELARDLAARGVAVGVLSNSEGRLAELLAEVGIADAFGAIVDSGRVGIAKPDPRIFAHALAALDAEPTIKIHIGDSWAADVEGARGAGWTPIWFGPAAVARDGVAAATDATALRAVLDRLL